MCHLESGLRMHKLNNYIKSLYSSLSACRWNLPEESGAKTQAKIAYKAVPHIVGGIVFMLCFNVLMERGISAAPWGLIHGNPGVKLRKSGTMAYLTAVLDATH